MTGLPMTSTVAMRGAYLAATDVDWERLGDGERHELMRGLWRNASAQGDTKLVLTHSRASSRPLAYASAAEVVILSAAGAVASD